MKRRTAVEMEPAARSATGRGVWAVFYDDSSGLALYPTAESACCAAEGTGREVAFVPFGQDFITIEGGFEFAAHPPIRSHRP